MKSAVLRGHVEQELKSARHAEAAGDIEAAWRALERAHVLSQPSARLHVRAHAAMLGLGLREGDAREVVGQLVRVLLAGPSSWLGRAPLGNIGRARVGLFTPMPIAEDLARKLQEAV